MQHSRLILLLLTVFFVMVITSTNSMCMADANSTNSTNTSLNMTHASGKDPSVQGSGSSGYVKGYDMKPEAVVAIPESQDLSFSKFDLVASLVVAGGVGILGIAALVAVFVVVVIFMKKKKN